MLQFANIAQPGIFDQCLFGVPDLGDERSNRQRDAGLTASGELPGHRCGRFRRPFSEK
jgi:hypothetical protein